ncbi:L-2-hydroxyglutarate oxidase [Nitratireductor sp.]|uniref:L-2-hydroxyglutarate oxidase n=1 Tax=Nitratireductor sp. TaxID=1872084 RepID=UPI00260144B6|nr:L-2-hydroxyglutarate oxidase [Nitratireductor sp.]
MTSYDFAIIGGGIVGLATARRLQALHPQASVVLFEKEEAVALHQSGRNSGVIHAGVYYTPGSLKAQFCSEGGKAVVAYCDEHGIRYQICGKLIVAVDDAETERLGNLHRRATANGIEIERLSGAEARMLEPNISVEAALLSPSTGIVDFAAISRDMAKRFLEAGGTLKHGCKVTCGSEKPSGIRLETSEGTIEAGKAVFCAGLMADRMAQAFGADVDFRIVPFRGEYYRIVNQPDDLVQHLIYPVPDPERPFLGVHLTKKMDGGFTVGPNAVLAFAREGYGRLSLNLRDLADSLTYPGFWRVIARNAGPAVDELSASLMRSRYLKKVQKYCSTIRLENLAPYRSGIRAQAISRDGKLMDDFHFVETRHSLHVCNAPSPAATSSIPIGAYIVERLLK